MTGELLAFQERMGERPLLLPEQLPRSIDAIFATQRGEGDASDYEVVFAQGGWNAIVCVHHDEASCGQGAGDAIVSGEIGTGEKYSISLLDVTHIPNKLTQGEVEGFWTTTAIVHNPDWLNAE